jgi:hypothetical protein
LALLVSTSSLVAGLVVPTPTLPVVVQAPFEHVHCCAAARGVRHRHNIKAEAAARADAAALRQPDSISGLILILINLPALGACAPVR